MSVFRIATRDEIWQRGVLYESRLSHGEAIEDDRGITATDADDAALLDRCGHEITKLREAMPSEGRVRLVATATNEDEVATTMTITLGGMSVVTSAEHAAADFALLKAACRAASQAAVEPDNLRGRPTFPLVWRNGSAAVLLHEAVGHALEHDQPDVTWPAWLSCDAPLRMRRATFRDVPLRRMTSVVVRQNGAPFELPFPRIEVLLVAGGSYEPLTETVTIQIAAADLVNESGTTRLSPFEIRESRSAIAEACIGAEGEPVRYPGVVCSREGQELVVGSFAPLLVTRFR